MAEFLVLPERRVRDRSVRSVSRPERPGVRGGASWSSSPLSQSFHLSATPNEAPPLASQPDRSPGPHLGWRKSLPRMNTRGRSSSTSGKVRRRDEPDSA